MVRDRARTGRRRCRAGDSSRRRPAAQGVRGSRPSRPDPYFESLADPGEPARPSARPGWPIAHDERRRGQRAENVVELFFDDVPVPARNLLGTRGRGLAHLMERLPTERMSIAWYALAAAEQALEWTLEHARTRVAFGAPIARFQNTRFVLADLATRLDVTRAYLERCVEPWTTPRSARSTPRRPSGGRPSPCRTS